MRGNGRIFARGSILWLSYYLDGQEYRESTGQSDARKAEKMLRKRLDEVGADREGVQQFTTPKMKRMTVQQLLDDLKNDLRLRHCLSGSNLSGIKLAGEEFGHIRAADFDNHKHVQPYIDKQQAAFYADASINRVLAWMRQAFRLAVKEKRFTRVPHITQLSEKENIRTGFVDAATFDVIRRNLPDDVQDFAEFGFLTGWRRGEIAGLEWSNIDGDMIRLRPDQSKNKNGRTVPIVGPLADVIERRRQARQVEVDGTTRLVKLVFHRDGQPVGDFRKVWRKACDVAGKPNLIFHDLRRSAVTAMVNSRVPQLIAMGISGHKTASMFQRYGIKVEDEQRDAMRATEAYHLEQRKKAAAKQQAAANVAVVPSR